MLVSRPNVIKISSRRCAPNTRLSTNALLHIPALHFLTRYLLHLPKLFLVSSLPLPEARADTLETFTAVDVSDTPCNNNNKKKKKMKQEQEEIREEKKQRKREEENVVTGTIFITRRTDTYCSEGSQAVPARPSGKGMLKAR